MFEMVTVIPQNDQSVSSLLSTEACKPKFFPNCRFDLLENEKRVCFIGVYSKSSKAKGNSLDDAELCNT